MKIQEGSLSCAAELLPFLYSPGSNTPKIETNVANIGRVNYVISADFSPFDVCLFSYCVLVLKIAAGVFAAAQTTAWLKLFCSTNDKLMDMKHSSLG